MRGKTTAEGNKSAASDWSLVYVTISEVSEVSEVVF